MKVEASETKWRAAGLILVGLLLPGGSLIVLSLFLAKRMWGGKLVAPVWEEGRSQ